MDRPKLPEDLKGQAWVAIGIPVGLAVLSRSAKEIEAGLKRRYRLLAGLTAQIATAAAELAALRGAIDAERPSCGVCGATVEGGDGLCHHESVQLNDPPGLCIAHGCKRDAIPGTWHCPEDTPTPAGEVTAPQ